MLHAVSVPAGVVTVDEALLLQVETQLESNLGQGQLHLIIPAGTTGPGNLHWVHAANPSVATMPTKVRKEEPEELNTKEEQVIDVGVTPDEASLSLEARDMLQALQAKAEAFEGVDADKYDEPAERSDTETSSIDDGCLVEGHFAERLSVLGESGLCKEKPSNERKQKKQRIDGTFAGAPREAVAAAPDAYVPRWQVIALLKDVERKVRKGQAYMPRGQVVRLLKHVENIIETGCPPETWMTLACPPATAAPAAAAATTATAARTTCPRIIKREGGGGF